VFTLAQSQILSTGQIRTQKALNCSLIINKSKTYLLFLGSCWRRLDCGQQKRNCCCCVQLHCESLWC